MSIVNSLGASPGDLKSPFKPLFTLQMLRRRNRAFPTFPANCLGQQPMMFVRYPSLGAILKYLF